MSESFQSQVRAWTLKTTISTEKQVRAVALMLFAKVVIRTPYGKPWTWKSKAPEGYVGGRARGNWQISFGPQPVAEETDNKVGEDSGAATAHVTGQLGAIKLGEGHPKIVWLSNSLPYIKRLEYDSWSQQAPAGMVRVSLSEIGAIVSQA